MVELKNSGLAPNIFPLFKLSNYVWHYVSQINPSYQKKYIIS